MLAEIDAEALWLADTDAEADWLRDPLSLTLI